MLDILTSVSGKSSSRNTDTLCTSLMQPVCTRGHRPPDAGRHGGKTRRGRPRRRWLDGKTNSMDISSIQSLSGVRLFATPWTAARQAFLSITNSQRLLKLMFIKAVMPINHLILCYPLLFGLQSFQHQGLFQTVSSFHQLAKVLEFQLQLWSFQRIFRTDFP